jgi:Zn-dependent protease with chaperone function
MLLDHGPVMRRKDLGVSEPVTVEPHLARRDSRRHIQIILGAFVGGAAAEGVVVGFLVGHPFLGMIVGLGVGVGYFIVAREFGDVWIARALRTGAEPGPRVVRLAAAEAKTAGVPSPRVIVAPGEHPNATSFALRRRWLVTTQASEQLDELALEGLVAHEIVHLRDGDSAVSALFVVLAGSPDLVMRGAGILTLLSVPLWPAAFVVRALRGVVLPSDREHRADVAAAMLTRYPPGIVAALEASGGPSAGLRPYDALWFVGRDGGAKAAADRAALIAEM